MFERLASDAAVPARTVREYFQVLQDTLLATLLQPFTPRRPRRKPASRAKLYFFDVGVANLLAGITRVEAGSPAFGLALEQLIFCELSAWLSYSRDARPLTFWRTVDGSEVDFVVGETAAIEVKATGAVTRRDLTGLRRLADETAAGGADRGLRGVRRPRRRRHTDSARHGVPAPALGRGVARRSGVGGNARGSLGGRVHAVAARGRWKPAASVVLAGRAGKPRGSRLPAGAVVRQPRVIRQGRQLRVQCSSVCTWPTRTLLQTLSGNSMAGNPRASRNTTPSRSPPSADGSRWALSTNERMSATDRSDL